MRLRNKILRSTELKYRIQLLVIHISDQILSNGRCCVIIEASKMEKALYGFDKYRTKNESKQIRNRFEIVCHSDKTIVG